MEKKITQKDMFNEVIALATANGREDIVKFAEERIAALDKKSANRKPSKNQTANEEIKAEILEFLEGSEGNTCTEIKDGLSGDYSLNKIVALMTQLSGGAKPKDGVEYPVVRFSEGKVVKFRLAQAIKKFHKGLDKQAPL